MKKSIWVRCICNDYYYFIKRISNVIDVIEFKVVDNYLYLKILACNKEKLDKLFLHVKFDVIEDSGIYFIINKIKDNMFLFLASILGIIIFLFLNNIIVDVDILNDNNDLVSILEEELRELDIKPLTIRKDYNDLDKIKKHILNEYEDRIDWLEIEVVGMKYVIRFEERIIKSDVIEDSYCNLYAKKNGVIKSIHVNKGEARVAIGDYVREGDLLISGDVILNENSVDKVCASGEVFAEVWYQNVVKIPLKYNVDKYTGEVRYNFLLEYDNNKEYILINRLDNYKGDKSLLFDLFGYKLYMEKQMEVRKKSKIYSEEDAINEAFRLSKEKIEIRNGEKDCIINQNVLKKNVINSILEVEIFVIAEEVIN